MKSFQNLHSIAKQAAWHFIEGNRDEYDVGAILDPYKYRYTSKRELDLYPEWSELCLDFESELSYALENPEEELMVMDLFEVRALDIIEKL